MVATWYSMNNLHNSLTIDGHSEVISHFLLRSKVVMNIHILKCLHTSSVIFS